MTTPSKLERHVIPPDQVKAILEGLSRDRPDLVDESALRALAPSSTLNVATRSADHDALVADLLQGIRDPGPALVTYSTRLALTIARLATIERALDRVPEVASAQTWLDLQERLTRLRDAEDAAVQRGLIVLDALRDRRIVVSATVVRDHARRRGRGR